ncbi:MAG: hypothetical protein ACI9LZ_004166, partial [Glaciecola sp.]
DGGGSDTDSTNDTNFMTCFGPKMIRSALSAGST